jgi:hypothetical protein
MTTLNLLKNLKTVSNSNAIKGGKDITVGVSFTSKDITVGVSFTSVSLSSNTEK